MVDQRKLSELRHNYEAFARALPTLLPDHEGKYALMRHGRLIDWFDRPGDALRSGRERYEDGLFSVQEATNRVADLGWYSRAPADPSL